MPVSPGSLMLAGLVFGLSVLLFQCVSVRWRGDLCGIDPAECWQAGSAAMAVMAHSALVTFCCLVPSEGDVYRTAGVVLLSLFLLRLTLTDLMTGLLPREMTVSCLLAGLLFATGSGELAGHILAALALWLLLATARSIAGWFYRTEALGLGDVWMGSALGAWLGFFPAVTALLMAWSGCLLWMLLSGTRKTALGPWMSYSAQAVVLLTFIEPFVAW
ncbi:prepilin peptidase [Salmonella enterica]|nr:prepilin peptidase [Salmonella enterica]EBY8686088.1 prepilin peptidase [Salmonella enterica subsp. enterica serovar Agona]MDQ7447794.1 prepilin peptidase [Salmonella enterica subsp. enterica serovar Agona]MDQ7466083.1 prepilin peptidase [Salmonella enterica subsp. enterica serovar Agona]MDQ7484403.1 prepilin peptidase [Salmonella enterica subsp. enterica serovar Agona]MDQ7686862.1 prepilin peptidase [Salmonella enterica subsp. enterica serovar Agona]